MHLLCILHRSSITTCCQKPVFSWGGGAVSGFVQPSIPSSGRDIINIICLAYLMTEWLDFQSYDEQKNKWNKILPFIFLTAKIPKLNSGINLWRLCLQNKSNSLTKAVTVLTLPSITRWTVVVWIMKIYWQFPTQQKTDYSFWFLIKNKYSVLNVLFNFPLCTELGKAPWRDQMLQSLARWSLCLLFLSAVITFWHVLLKYLGLLCNLH